MNHFSFSFLFNSFSFSFFISYYVSEYSMSIHHLEHISIMPRIAGIDFNKGIAIAGMLFFHAFQTGIANNDSEVTMNFAFSLPPFVTYGIILPFVFISHLGSLFAFLTVMTTTISTIRIFNTDRKRIWGYLFGRFLFAIALKLLELFYYSILLDHDFLHELNVTFPDFKIPIDADTLDIIGILGFIVPTFITLLLYIPKVPYYVHILLLLIISNIWWAFYPQIGDASITAAKWLYKYGFNLLSIFFYKCGVGTFQVSEMLPVGLLGGAWGLLLSNTTNWKHYMYFTIVVVGLCWSIGGVLLAFTPDIISHLGEDRKPLGYLLFIQGFINLMHFVHTWFTDGPRDPQKLLKSRKHTRLYNRFSVISLSAFVLDAFVERQLMKFFVVFFGESTDFEKKVVLWNPWIVLLFMVVYILLWYGLSLLWEKCHFRFSLEHQLSYIIQWLYQRPYNKMDYKKVIYGPVWEIEQKLGMSLSLVLTL